MRGGGADGDGPLGFGERAKRARKLAQATLVVVRLPLYHHHPIYRSAVAIHATTRAMA